MSLVVEEQVLASISSTLGGLGSGETGEEAWGLSLVRFISDVRTVVNALLLGAGLEGGRFERLVEDYRAGPSGVPVARAVVVVEGIVFYLYAKPLVDVVDVDIAVDEAGEAAEKLGLEGYELVPVVAAYEYTFDAERYAKSIEVELVRLGL